MSTLAPAAVTAIQKRVDTFFELSLFAMVVTAFAALAGTGKLDPLSVLFVLAALGLRAYHFATGRRVNLSVRTTTRLTIAYAAFYAFDLLFLSGSFVTATVHLVLFLMVTKVYSVHQNRDYMYQAVISFMMILAAAILTVDSFFLGAFVIFLLLTVATFTSMEMRRSFQDTLAPGDGPAPPKDRAVGSLTSGSSDAPRRMSRALALSAPAMVIGIALAATVIFFGLPRVSASYLTQLSARNNFVSGFSDNVKLGEIGRIQQSDTVVMHVQFARPELVPADLKWRAVSYSTFDGVAWSKGLGENRQHLARTPDGRLDLARVGVSGRVAGQDRIAMPRVDQVLRYRVSMQPIGTNYFFLLPVPTALATDAHDFMYDEAGAIGLNDPTRQILSYQAASILLFPSPETRVGKELQFPLDVTQQYLQLPPLDPRVAALALQLTRNAPSVYEKAAAIERYLQTQYGYTLEMAVSPDPSVDPITYFLFTRKRGHCEYFASAMALMLRTQGVPSRVVNGFRGGQFNDISGSFIVRARDAHTWVEAFIPGFGWTTFDPTPAADAVPQNFWSRASLYLDAAREFWNEWVVNYDMAHQTTLAENTATNTRQKFDAMRLWVRKQYDAMLDRLRKLQSEVSRSPQTFGMRGLAIFVGLLVLIALPKLYKYLRSLRLAARPRKAPRQAATVWYERLLRLLGRRGMEKLPAQTAKEYVASLPSDPTLGGERLRESVTLFTAHYERARFGGSEDDAAKLPDLYEEVEEALKR